MALWTPDEITTDLWLDASDSSTITIATGVSQWTDKSGHNRHAVQAIGSAQPTISAAWQNGLNALNFNGSSQYLSCGDVLDLATGGLTAICVAQANNPGAFTGIIYAKSIAAAGLGRYHLGWLISANNLSASFTLDTSGGISVSAATSSTSANLCGQVIDRGGTEQVLLNGVSTQTSFTANAANLNTATRFLIGAYSNATDTGLYVLHNGRICEIVLVLQALPVDDIKKVEGYLAWKWGTVANLPVDHPYKSAAPTIPDHITLNRHLFQPYTLLTGDPLNVANEHPYGITADLDEVALSQLYSMLMETWIAQHYGDVPVLGRSLIQPYRSAPVLNKALDQRWADALQIERSLLQEWSMPGPLEASSEQSYGICAEVLELTCEQLYAINERTTLFAGLIQPYALAGEAARLYQFDTKLYINGERIPYHSLEWQATDTEYTWSCDFAVKCQAVAMKCVDGALINITSAGDTWQLKCYDGWTLDARHGSTLYRVRGYSRTRDLDLALPLLGDLPGGMASVLVADLAEPFGVTVDWQMADGYLPAGRVTANDETPMAVIRNIVHDARGILLSTPEGNLLIVAEEETPIPDWPTVVPADTIIAHLERISTSERPDVQRGYNRFIVSDQLASGDGFRWDEVSIDGSTKEVRLFVVPFDAARQFVLGHSGGTNVSIEPFGIKFLNVVAEQVEIVAGSGKTTKPIYGVVSSTWQKANLGAVSHAEDGLLAAATPGYSLLSISYQSKYFKWIVKDSNIEDVQFVFHEVKR